MKRDQKQALREMSTSELQKKAADLQLEVAKARINREAGKLEDTASVNRLRDEIAVIKTIMTEKEAAERKN